MRDQFREMFEEMRRMQHDMDRLTRRMTVPVLIKKKKDSDDLRIRSPVTALKETETEVLADIEMPGMNKEDIQINVTPGHIEVAAKQKIEKKTENSYSATERNYYKTFSLPAEINPEKVDASYKNGILHLKLKKVKQLPKSKQIQIK
ncbi:hypothetical protein COV16_02225 [Candidatus Woesearchaeota archaeon CG10_big_fil_rev_8_21_14_0_10_34_8]|nr:MAG: hypothetical protein COV16_02225 [Candidatus Woesearchaeota archaeon CG10_big_fil_rev_8_21_14_0_10_34_8]